MDRDWARVHRVGAALHRDLQELTADTTKPPATIRLFASGLEQITRSLAYFESRTRTSMWNLRVRTALDLDGYIEDLDARSAARGLQMIQVISPYSYEACPVPGLIEPGTLMGPTAFQGILLDGDTFLFAGANTPTGRPTGWVTRDPAILRRALRLWNDVHSLSRPIPAPTGPDQDALAIGKLVARGWSNRRIAAATHLSVRSVERHIAALERQLRVPDRAALAALIAGTGR